jgi:nicotinate-nucleotide pyrophosphorylase (carboxylating)
MHITKDIETLIDLAIYEDYISGDPTTESLIDSSKTGAASIISDQEGILAGIDIALFVFSKMSSSISTKAILHDGVKLKKGSEIATIEGPLSSILTAERTALNFLQLISGVATETSKYVAEISGTKSKIVDTRKTVPGFRRLQKYAVRIGGGKNHRHNLSDGILIKDNHISAFGGSIGSTIDAAKKNSSHTLKIEIEVETLTQVQEALDAKADIIMLDNMSTSMMSEAVKLCEGKAVTEASGGVTLSTVREIAETGVDIISIGAITHSAPNLDISLDITSV